MNLPGRARAGLNEVQRLLRQQASVERPRREWVGDLIAWCRQHDIELGARLGAKALRFDAELLQQIDAVLASARLAPLGRALGGLPSSAQAKAGMEENKATREGPRAWRVLLNLPPQPAQGLGSDARSIRDVDVRSLTLGAFGALVQVENLDSFYTFDPNISALRGYAHPLVIYRGDSHYGQGFHHLTDTWRKTRRPHLYLGDFDAKGVTLALDSGATHLLLPEIDWLTEHATPLHQPAEQLPFQRRLRQLHVTLEPQHPLAPYLALLEKQRGLRQQWFEGVMVCVGLG